MRCSAPVVHPPEACVRCSVRCAGRYPRGTPSWAAANSQLFHHMDIFWLQFVQLCMSVLRWDEPLPLIKVHCRFRRCSGHIESGVTIPFGLTADFARKPRSDPLTPVIFAHKQSCQLSHPGSQVGR